MLSFVRVIGFLILTLLIVSCTMRPGGFEPPPLVMLWDKIPAGINEGKTLKLAFFHPDESIKEFDFAPQWSMDAFADTRSGLVAFNGGVDPLSLDEALRCFDIVTGEETFAKTDGQWVPLGFIEEGWSLVALKREAIFRILHGREAEEEDVNFTDHGYRLKYTVHLIDVLTGEADEGMVIYDSGSENIRWEDRSGFEPKLASDAGLLFAALPEFPYVTKKIEEEKRPAKLWALDLRSYETRGIDLENKVRDWNFSFIVSNDGRSVFFQSQDPDDTVSLNLPNYGNSKREWGSLYLWRNGETIPIAKLDGKHVRHQMGISRRGKMLLFAEVEFDTEMLRAKEGTLALYLNDHSGEDERRLPIEGDVWNLSLSPGGRFVGYLISGSESLQLRLLDTIRREDILLTECGPYSRFYGFAGAGRGDIAIPHLNRMLFGFQNPVARL